MQKFLVIGLGRFGTRLARTLAATGAEVVAIDRDRKMVDEIRDHVTLAVRLDATDEEALLMQGIQDVDCAIVGIGHHFESAALTVAILKSLSVRRVIARAENDMQAEILSRIGADQTVLPEKESALRWAHRLMLPNLQEYVELGEGHSIVYASAPESFFHKSLKDLQLRNRYGVNLVAIKREIAVRSEPGAAAARSTVIEVPDATAIVLPHDVLILVGSNESLSRLPTE